MPKRMRIDVTHDKRGGTWVVKGGGETHTFPTKTAAVRAASSAGRNVRNAQVIIRKKDGTIQSERTYGNDPRRSPG